MSGLTIDKYDMRGRKFTALLIAAFLLIFIVILVTTLALMGKEIPYALGGAMIALASCFPGYLGVNVYQKRIEANKAEEKHE